MLIFPSRQNDDGLFHEFVSREVFENDNGQRIVVEVRGDNSDRVNRYLEELNLDFEIEPVDLHMATGGDAAHAFSILRANSATALRLQTVSELNVGRELSPRRLKRVTDLPFDHDDQVRREVLDLLVVIDWTVPNEIEPPSRLRLAIDPTLGKDETHGYTTYGKQNKFEVTVTAKGGSITAKLFEGSVWWGSAEDRADVDIFSRTPARNKETLEGSSTVAKNFTLTLKGNSDDGNTYNLGVDMYKLF